ncbi:MAG: anthranilate synthase component 1 [Succinivibrionaceae bacterium]|nr:anthranilate synthase component 1 [Succinivibrionaceae bacterium]
MSDNIKIEDFVTFSDYVEEPQDLFEQLTRPFDNTLLLESAEIDTKAGTKSVLITSSSNRISCFGNTVFFQALTPNGFNVNDQLYEILKNSKELTVTRNGNVLTAVYPELPSNLDEDSRLKSTTVLDALRVVLRQLRCDQGSKYIFLGGCFAYDLIAGFEKLPQVKVSPNDCPDFCFYLAETMIRINHITQETKIYGITFSGRNNCRDYIMDRVQALKARCDAFKRQEPQKPEKLQGVIESDLPDAEFCKIVEQLKENIRKGDIFQVVPSRTFAVNCPSALASYRQLKIANPSPYMFYLNDEMFTIFGASPESSVKYTAETNEVEMYPIAGTRKRGFKADGTIDLDLDGRIELYMRQDVKEVAEHLMLVDLARNDIARISQPGTRYVKDLLKVDRYSQVMHLVSHVVGQLRSDLDAIHAYQACMNMGTLTGAPKIRATELIRSVERKRRGSYGGAIGWISGNGDMDTCIVIRSAFVKNQTAYIQAGAGVVYDSVPQSEADETFNKAKAVLSAIAAAHGTTLKEIIRNE